MNKDINIIYVEKANDFIGFNIDKNGVTVYAPQSFRKEDKYKSDLIALLKSISLAKTKEIEKNKKGSDKSNIIWPVESYLWIVRDYLENGFYYNREKTYSNSNSGKIDWKKTLKQVPIFSNGNIIYDKLVTSKMAASNDLVAEIYKLCLKHSVSKIGWLYNFDFYIEAQQFVSVTEMVSIIKKELDNTFDDIRRMRFNHMLKILNTSEGTKVDSNTYTYGIENYYYVFETMVDMLFDGLDEKKKKQYNPNGYWQLNNQGEKKASSLRPDTILKIDGKTYILDSKMYQFGVTHKIEDLPETQSLQKQITYGDYVSKIDKTDKVRNAFILPYDKKKEFDDNIDVVRYRDGDLAYIGEAHVDWRNDKSKTDYDNIYAYLIDFNYLLRNYKRADYQIIHELCQSIENKINSKKEDESI